MTDYEIELGSLTEHRDLSTGDVDRVVVETHVRRAEQPRGVAEPQSGDYTVTFGVADGHARFHSVETDTGLDDLALVAVRAAAEQLETRTDDYTVEAPLGTVREATYTTHDQP